MRNLFNFQLFFIFLVISTLEAFNSEWLPKNPDIFLTKKLEFLNKLVEKAVICHQRYEECSRRFTAAFCISPVQHFSFFIWARRMANNIMNGKYDEHKTTTCSTFLVENIINGKIAHLIKATLNSTTRSHGNKIISPK